MLAIETSTARYGIVLAANGQILFDSQIDLPADAPRDLADWVAAGLSKIGKTAKDISAIGVDIGPGSLGSIRDGLAFADGLAFGLDIPIHAYKSLELMGFAARQQTRLPVLCVRRAPGGQVFAGLYGNDGLGPIQFGTLEAVASTLVAKLPAFAAAGNFRDEIAVFFTGAAVTDTGIEIPSARTIIEIGTAGRRAAHPLHEPIEPVTQENLAASHDDADAVACLAAGGVVLLATDTVYGLAIRPDMPRALEQLFKLKNRPPERQLPVMVASPDDLPALGVQISDAARRLLHSPYVPGPLTIAFGFGDGARPAWLEGRKEVAVRIPANARLLSILRRTGPLLVTSANAHGRETPREAPLILAQLLGAPDLVIDGGVLDVTPATLVNCNVDPPVIEREGVVTRAMLRGYL